MVGQILDSAMIGSVLVRLTLGDGVVVEGIPSAPASDISGAEELDDSGYARCVSIAGIVIDLTDVRQVTIVHPAPG
jgi:hypothetical protein